MTLAGSSKFDRSVDGDPDRRQRAMPLSRGLTDSTKLDEAVD